MTVDLNSIIRTDIIRQPVRITFRDKEYELPSRDAELLDRLISAEKAMSEAASGREKAEALKQGISAFLGSEEADSLYPDIMHADLDEMQRLYLIMTELAARKSKEIIEAEYLTE